MIRLCLLALAVLCLSPWHVSAQCPSCPGGVCSPGVMGAPAGAYGYYQERSYGYQAPAWSGGVYSAPAWSGGCPCQQGAYRYAPPVYRAPLVIPRVEERRQRYPAPPPLRDRLRFRPGLIVRRFR